MSATNFLERTIYNTLFQTGVWNASVGPDFGLAPQNLELVLMHTLPDEDGAGAVEASSPASGDDITGFTPGYLRIDGAAGTSTPIEDTSAFFSTMVGSETGIFTNDTEMNFGGNWSGVSNAPAGDLSDYGPSRTWLTIVGWAIKVQDAIVDFESAADGYFTTNPDHRWLFTGNFYDANGDVTTYEPISGNSFLIPASAFILEIE